MEYTRRQYLRMCETMHPADLRVLLTRLVVERVRTCPVRVLEEMIEKGTLSIDWEAHDNTTNNMRAGIEAVRAAKKG